MLPHCPSAINESRMGGFFLTVAEIMAGPHAALLLLMPARGKACSRLLER
jgi:hypothetical protein